MTRTEYRLHVALQLRDMGKSWPWIAQFFGMRTTAIENFVRYHTSASYRAYMINHNRKQRAASERYNRGVELACGDLPPFYYSRYCRTRTKARKYAKGTNIDEATALRMFHCDTYARFYAHCEAQPRRSQVDPFRRDLYNARRAAQRRAKREGRDHREIYREEGLRDFAEFRRRLLTMSIAAE